MDGSPRFHFILIFRCSCNNLACQERCLRCFDEGLSCDSCSCRLRACRERCDKCDAVYYVDDEALPDVAPASEVDGDSVDPDFEDGDEQEAEEK